MQCVMAAVLLQNRIGDLIIMHELPIDEPIGRWDDITRLEDALQERGDQDYKQQVEANARRTLTR